MERKTIRTRTLPWFVPAVILSFFLPSVIEYPTEDISSVLSILATVQGAIFAIVFSVLILAVQLSASRYSLRLPNMLIQTEAYQGTVVVFVISLGWTLVGMYLLPVAGKVLSRSIGFAAGLFALIAGFTLYIFINKSIAATTPEGIISITSENFSPAAFIDDAKRARTETLELEPFLLLSSITSSLINEGDGGGAKMGVTALGDNARETVEIHGSDIDDETAAKDELEDLLTEEFTGFLEDIKSNNLRIASSEVTYQLSRVGNKSVDVQYASGVVASLTGTTEGLYTEGNSAMADDIRETSAEAFADILTYATSNIMYEPLTEGLQRFGARAGRLMLQFDSEGTRGTSGMSIYMDTLPRIQDALIADMESRCRDIKAWPPQSALNSNLAPPRGAIPLWCTYTSTAEITSAILRNHESAVNLIVDPNFIANSWFRMADSAEEAGLTWLYLQWLGTAYYIDHIDDELGRPLNGAFDTRLMHTDTAHLRCALQLIRDDDIDVKTYIDMFPGNLALTDQTGRTGVINQIISNPHLTFDQYLDVQLQGLS